MMTFSVNEPITYVSEYKQLSSTTKFETQRSCECRGPLGKLDLFLLVSGHNF